MNQHDIPAPPPASDAGEDLPPTPALPADLVRWANDAAWGTPHVEIAQARRDEEGAIRVAATEVLPAGLIVTLDNGQVFRLAAGELTRPAALPGRPFTLNPPGQSPAHARGGETALCGLSGAGVDTSPEWAQVTCLDCRAAVPARALEDLDDLDRHTAERQVSMVLMAASPWPLPVYEVTRRVEPGYRAAVPAALGDLAARSAIIQAAPADGGQACWRWAPG